MFLKILRTSQSPTKREMKFFDYFLLDFRVFLTRFSTFFCRERRQFCNGCKLRALIINELPEIWPKAVGPP